METRTVCAFTGHRNINVTSELRSKIRREIINLIENGVNVFLNGGALGFDILCATEVLELKKVYPISLKMILPCKDQEKGWSEYKRDIYYHILENADEVTCICESYEIGCMHKRNRMLVDNSSYILAYCNNNKGGTYYTVEYAKKKGKTVINLF